MGNERVVIPATIEEAKASLQGLGQLLTARSWERAAIVYAFTRAGTPGEGGPGRGQDTSPGTLLTGQFAALGIHGLKSNETVRLYRARWAAHGDPNIKPGDEVTLPDIDWPPTDETDGDRGRLRVSPSTPIDEAVEHIANIHGAEAVARSLTKVDADAVERVVESLPRIPSPPKPEIPFGAETVCQEVDGYFAAAAREIGKAVELMERAVEAGLRFDELAFSALAGAPENWFDEVLVRYRKTVAMLVVEEGADR